MKAEQQYQLGVAAGYEAFTKAHILFPAWLNRQINQCKQLAPHYPYARGYVEGCKRAADAGRK